VTPRIGSVGGGVALGAAIVAVVVAGSLLSAIAVQLIVDAVRAMIRSAS
jgi:hypothetical protein